MAYKHKPKAFNVKPQTAGGLAVYNKYGRSYMAEIGRKGYEVTVEKHFDGDRDKANRWLTQKAHYVNDEDYRRRGFGKFRDPGPHPAHQETPHA